MNDQAIIGWDGETGWDGVAFGEDTVAGFSLSSFSKSLTHAVSSAAKTATNVVTTATSKVASLPASVPYVKKAMPVLQKLQKLPAVLTKKPFLVAMLPTTVASKALGATLKKAGLGKITEIMNAPEKLAQTVNSAMGNAAMYMVKGNPKAAMKALQAGAKQLKADPSFNVMLTGASFVPGLGQVSAGVATAVALGSGESMKDAALAGARQAIPGGPAAKAAFDLAVGLAKGKKLSDAALLAAREQLPGGPAGKAAFDAGLLLARRQATPSALVGVAREQLSAPGKAVFDKAWRGAQSAAESHNRRFRHR